MSPLVGRGRYPPFTRARYRAPVTQLARRLTLPDAVVIGLGSMIGAGVFAVWGPAAAASGGELFVGLALAAVVAFCNATSSAQLAAEHPGSGGTYLYGRRQLGPWWGFLAGWGFVIGKTASCAAMALTAASSLVPGPWQRPVAVASVVALAAVNYRGITRTARLARVIVAIVLVLLTAAVAANLASASAVGLLGCLARRACLAPRRPRPARTASSSRPDCCSSRSRAMPASPRWGRR